jgi:hypothetical protein
VSFSWQRYLSDDGNFYATKVNDEYVAMQERGWFELAAPGDTQYPRGWRLRRVKGITPTGDLVFADAATLEADIWSGAVSVFEFIDGSGAHVLATIIERQRERRLLITAPVSAAARAQWRHA